MKKILFILFFLVIAVPVFGQGVYIQSQSGGGGGNYNPASVAITGGTISGTVVSLPKAVFVYVTPGMWSSTETYGQAFTITSVGCQVDPKLAGKSVIVDVQDCSGTPATCTSILSNLVTCGNSPTAASLAATPTTIAAGHIVGFATSTVTGAVQ